ncbi:MAG: LptF/LptG family permease [Deltaproteobacteria bacterium]|nr:LptF/LptG family permease [Deltaproteobacteria bacterium]
MKIVHKYLLTESLGPFLIGLFTFSLVVLLQRFSRIADLVIAKSVPLPLVGKLLLSLFPTFLEIILPAALLLAILLALGRLGADSETTALRTAGIGMRGVLLPVLLLSGGTFLASLFIGWNGIPWGTRQMQQTLARIVSLRAGAGAAEHVFQEVAPDVLLFPDRVSSDGTRMSGILLSQRIAGKDPLLVFAKEGEFLPGNGSRIVSLSLADGTIHHEDLTSGAYRMAAFRGMDFHLPAGLAGAADTGDPKRLTLPELSRGSSILGNTGRGPSYRYHFHRRLSLAASCIAFGLFALPLGLARRARGKSPAFAITVALILFFYVFLAVGGALESRAPAAMVLLLWLPNALVLAAACWILWRSDKQVISLPALFRGATEKR